MKQIESVEMYVRGSCPFCVKAKELLRQRGIPVDVYEVGRDVSKEDIQSRVDAMGLNVQIRTVPQIFAEIKNQEDWEYIGGHDDLVNFLRQS